MMCKNCFPKYFFEGGDLKVHDPFIFKSNVTINLILTELPTL